VILQVLAGTRVEIKLEACHGASPSSPGSASSSPEAGCPRA
jgi:hypothetical protein